MGNCCLTKKSKKFQKSLRETEKISFAQAEDPYNAERNKKISKLPNNLIETISELYHQTHLPAEENKEEKLKEFFSQRSFEHFENTPPRFKNKEISQTKEEVFSYVLYRFSYFLKRGQYNLDQLQIISGSFLYKIIKIEEKFKTNFQDPKIYELDLDFHLSFLYFTSLIFLDPSVKIEFSQQFVSMLKLPIPYNPINQTPDDKILTETWPILQDIIKSHAFQKALLLLNFSVTKQTFVENNLLNEINQLTLDKIFWIPSGKLAGITTFQGRIGLSSQELRSFDQNEKIPHLLFTLINLVGNYIADFLVESGAGTPYLERTIAETGDKLKEFSQEEQQMLKEIGGKEGGLALQYFLFGDAERCYFWPGYEADEKTFREKLLSKESYEKWPVYTRCEITEMTEIKKIYLDQEF